MEENLKKLENKISVFDKKKKWVIAFYAYNSAVYDELVMEDNYGKLPKGYIPMEQQILALMQQLSLTNYDVDIQIVCFCANISYDIDFPKGKRTKEDIFAYTYEKGDELNKNGNLILDKKFINREGAMTSKSSISSTFSYLDFKYDYENIIIITYGHGSMFGVNYYSEKQMAKLINNMSSCNSEFLESHPIYSLNFDTVSEVFNQMLIKENTPIKKYYYKLGKFLLNYFDKIKGYKKESYEEVLEMTMLSNIELKKAIKERFKKKKVNILAMYNCYMQNIYSQVEFSSSVDEFVGASSGICLPGFNYNQIISNLIKNKSATNKEVANWFLSTIDASWKTGNEEKIDTTWFLKRTTLDKGLFQKIKLKFNDWMGVIINVFKKSKNYQPIRVLHNVLEKQYNYGASAGSKYLMHDSNTFLSRYLKSLKESVLIKKLDNADYLKIKVVTEELIKFLNTIDSTIFYNNKFFIPYPAKSYNDTRDFNLVMGETFVIPKGNKDFFKNEGKMLAAIFLTNQFKELTPDLINNTIATEFIKLINGFDTVNDLQIMKTGLP